ncbi:hypothetical protein HIM_00560 [Hirsutella minnesotensis 3608]|nr:hypothetical protein HIM_00560 [Hirsutella minnesotensis 3608]
MSGSPNIPPRQSREAHQRGEAPAQYPNAIPHDVYRDRSLQLPRAQSHQHLPPPRSYPHDELRAVHGFQRFEESMPLTPLYTPQPPRGPLQSSFQQQRPSSSAQGADGPYQMSSRGPATENQGFSPPKSQRKTKGHVASACVPCKRAHLRCDAQRPCSRCLSNGKEDACVDVQHKKRGRPRLRDDRDARFDPLRTPHYPDISSRRPLSVYPAGGSAQQPAEDYAQRQPPYRPYETPAGSIFPPRPFERATDAGMYNPAPAPQVYPEPVVYLTMNMEITKASPTFLDAIGAGNVVGRRLGDISAGTEADKIHKIQNQLLGEQKRREPNYLPPILGLGGPAFQGIGFSADDVARFPLEMEEQLAFIGADGHLRQFPIRAGLGEEGSFFFVVILLCGPPRYQHPPPAPARVASISPYHRGPAQQETSASRPAGPPMFDPIRHRCPEGPSVRSPSLQNLANQISPAASPGIISPVSPYGAPGERLRFSGPGDQRFQLPPIRAQTELPPLPSGQDRRRDDRSGRVGIEGLIERPEGNNRPR